MIFYVVYALIQDFYPVDSGLHVTVILHWFNAGERIKILLKVVGLGFVALLCRARFFGDCTEEFKMNFECVAEKDDCIVLLEEFSERKPQKAFIQEWTKCSWSRGGPVNGVEAVQDSECAQ